MRRDRIARIEALRAGFRPFWALFNAAHDMLRKTRQSRVLGEAKCIRVNSWQTRFSHGELVSYDASGSIKRPL